MYKYIQESVRSCEMCQHVKPAPSSQAPLRPLLISTEASCSVSMDFIFGLLPNEKNFPGVLFLVDLFSKMVHFAPVSAHTTAEKTAKIFINLIIRHHGLPYSIVSYRDPGLTSAFGQSCFDYWARVCLCLRRPIQKRMSKRSVSIECLKMSCILMRHRSFRKAHSFHSPNLQSTMQSMRLQD
ncbi:unnamed protein product [Peronospora belbahrii]|uniref:Integrase catalytic domain-containing protein n=1 Tax=Peronospora belbahrii TaxID=622444 RepID=A0AAU9L5A0_9STRA|nr:unnamed protein product [Peronospora belbahrii]